MNSEFNSGKVNRVKCHFQRFGVVPNHQGEKRAGGSVGETAIQREDGICEAPGFNRATGHTLSRPIPGP